MSEMCLFNQVLQLAVYFPPHDWHGLELFFFSGVVVCPGGSWRIIAGIIEIQIRSWFISDKPRIRSDISLCYKQPPYLSSVLWSIQGGVRKEHSHDCDLALVGVWGWGSHTVCINTGCPSRHAAPYSSYTASYSTVTHCASEFSVMTLDWRTSDWITMQ